MGTEPSPRVLGGAMLGLGGRRARRHGYLAAALDGRLHGWLSSEKRGSMCW
jgi:hypothetical protein